RADDAVRAAGDELEFAVAQFGAERTKSFATALERARRDLATAFELQSRLDDAIPDGDRRTKEWTKRIRALADRARVSLAEESARFRALRRAEASAPETVADLRRAIAHVEERRAEAAALFVALARDYAREAIVPVER